DESAVPVAVTASTSRSAAFWRWLPWAVAFVVAAGRVGLSLLRRAGPGTRECCHGWQRPVVALPTSRPCAAVGDAGSADREGLLTVRRDVSGRHEARLRRGRWPEHGRGHWVEEQ